MMENAELYSAQEIEKIKLKIETYRDTLTTLKNETSIEDYLLIKNEFDKFKKQISHLDGLSKTMDVKQSTQIGEYEEQVKQISNQIDFLNQTIEEINQEFILILKKLIIDDNTELTDNKISPTKNNTLLNISNRKTLVGNQSLSTNDQPSFRQLQNLAGKAIDVQNNGLPTARHDQQQQERQPETRHFNQQYFQLTNTHPSHIYNGLYKNTTTEATLQFKNSSNIQETSANQSENNSPPSTPLPNELEKTDAISSAEPKTTEKIEFPTKDINNVQTVSIDKETNAIESPSEEISPQTEPPSPIIDEENKKEWAASFLNIFRKRR